jgi:hypothetical protein
VRRGVALIPTTGLTKSGLYVDLEPVEVVSTSDRSALQRAIERTASRGNPRASEPGRSPTAASVVLKLAKSRSWSEFERSASTWAIDEKDGRLRIIAYRPSEEGGWEEDPQRTEVLPPTSGIQEAALRLAALIA